MSNLELRIDESSDLSFHAVDFVGVPFAPTVEVEDIEGGHRVSITSMGAEGKKTDEFDVMDGADGATGPQGPKGDSYEITAADYAEIAEVVEGDIQDVIDAAQGAASDATAAAAEARAASAATWLNGNVLFGELEEAAVLTADDAYAAPPKGVEVFGKSTQDGTPTPDAPVEIQSVDNLTLNVCGKNVLDAANPAVSNYATYTYENDTLTVTAGHANTWCYQRYRVPAVEWMQGQNVTLSMIASGTSTPMFGIEFYRDDDSRISYATSASAAITRTVPSDTSYIDVLFYARNTAAGAVGDTATYRNIQLELGSTATAYEPYVGQSVSIPLSDHIARSLPNGTRDTLTLSYIGPSTEHEGWGVFSKTLVQRVAYYEVPTNDGGWSVVNDYLIHERGNIPSYQGWVVSKLCNVNASNKVAVTSKVQIVHGGVTLESFLAAMDGNPVTLQMALATPVTHDLGTVELPILPNPLTAWADGGSAQPTMALSYEQDINIVISELRAAIADMATS